MSQTDVSIHVVDDDVSVREAVGCLIRSAGWRVETFASAQEFLLTSQKNIPNCLVLDVKLPGLNGLDLQEELAKTNMQIPIVFLTGHGDIPMTVKALKAGAMDFLTKPVDDEDLLQAIREGLACSNVWRKRNERDGFGEIIGSSPGNYVPGERCDGEIPGFEGIVGISQALREVLDLILTVAPTDATVLIEGETGTGKELIAEAIHAHSGRRTHHLVKLNCSAIPAGLLESDLFGHEKGAFTGAVARKIGRFEVAHGGTLFLDEIGDIPLELQAKLLRIIQEGEFERLGSTQTLQVNARLVAATNASLNQMVAEKKFRRDLYYRLHVFPINVPPLRERRDDIPLLVRHFANKYAARMGKTIERIPNETLDALSRYDWPGNIRELQNLMERSVLLSTGPSLRVPLAEILHGSGASAVGGNTLKQAERQLIQGALRESNWVVGGARGAATRLGLSRTTLAYKMQKLGISRPQ